jgi:hypothetical protein
MKLSSPEGRGLVARACDVLGLALLLPCIATETTDPETGVVIRRERLFGLIPVRDSAWRNGLLHGTEVWHALRSDVRKRLDWQDGIPHGAWREWHGNGVKAFECALEHAVLHGRATRWRRNGTKAYQGEYRNGAKTGEWYYLTKHGKLDAKRTGLYVDGERLSGIKGFNEWLGSP